MLLELTEAGPSAMQDAEVDMARDKGVPIVELHFDGLSTEANIKAQLTEKWVPLVSDKCSESS